MEHIIQFGINIDDESIKRTVMESGVKTIEAQIKQAIINKVFTAYRYGNAKVFLNQEDAEKARRKNELWSKGMSFYSER